MRAALVRQLGPCAPTQVKAENGAYQINEAHRYIGGMTQRLANTLVPIAARNVRFCKYSSVQQLAVSRVLSGNAAAQLERDANRLLRSKQVVTGRAGGCADPLAYPHGGDVISYFLTFANDSQKVAVIDGGCGTVANGFFDASPTTAWLREIHVLTVGVDPRLGTTGPQG